MGNIPPHLLDVLVCDPLVSFLHQQQASQDAIVFFVVGKESEGRRRDRDRGLVVGNLWGSKLCFNYQIV
jgi:hypothetical protein